MALFSVGGAGCLRVDCPKIVKKYFQFNMGLSSHKLQPFKRPTLAKADRSDPTARACKDSPTLLGPDFWLVLARRIYKDEVLGVRV